MRFPVWVAVGSVVPLPMLSFPAHALFFTTGSHCIARAALKLKLTKICLFLLENWWG